MMLYEDSSSSSDFPLQRTERIFLSNVVDLRGSVNKEQWAVGVGEVLFCQMFPYSPAGNLHVGCRKITQTFSHMYSLSHRTIDGSEGFLAGCLKLWSRLKQVCELQ